MFDMLPDAEYAPGADWATNAAALKASVSAVLETIEGAFHSCPESESGLILEMRHTARKLHNISSRVASRVASGEGNEFA